MYPLFAVLHVYCYNYVQDVILEDSRVAKQLHDVITASQYTYIPTPLYLGKEMLNALSSYTH